MPNRLTRRLSVQWSRLSVAASSPSLHILHIYNVYTAVWFFAGATDKFITGTVYVFAGEGFDGTRGKCVSGQLATETVLFVVATLGGLLASWWAIRQSSLSRWHLVPLFFLAPFLLLVDNNLMAHCSFDSGGVKEGTLVGFAGILIFLGIIHTPAIISLNPVAEKFLLEKDPRHRSHNRARGQTHRSLSDSAREAVEQAEVWYKKDLRLHVVIFTLSIQYALAADHVTTAVNDIMMQRGFDPTKGKCLDGQLATELVVLAVLTVIGVIAISWRGMDVLAAPWFPKGKVPMTRRVAHGLLTLVIVPGYTVFDNSQIVHCYRKHSEESAEVVRTLAAFVFLVGVFDIFWFFKAKMAEIKETEEVNDEAEIAQVGV